MDAFLNHKQTKIDTAHNSLADREVDGLCWPRRRAYSPANATRWCGLFVSEP